VIASDTIRRVTEESSANITRMILLILKTQNLVERESGEARVQSLVTNQTDHIF